jgi:hypothetical protein
MKDFPIVLSKSYNCLGARKQQITVEGINCGFSMG